MSVSNDVMKKETEGKRWVIGAVVFVVLAIIGLFWAKWNPYFHKAFTAASTHFIGNSIISGTAATAEAPSWSAAWHFSVTYFLAIWKAFIVAILLGSLLQVLIPQNWVARVLGKTTYGSTFVAGVSALPGMMCTCCSAPLVVGLRKQQSSVSAAIAFWFGNTALNPAVLVFMFFVLGWKFMLLRLIFGIILVFGLSYLIGKMVRNEEEANAIIERTQKAAPLEQGQDRHFFIRWFSAISKLALTLIPAYILSVLVLGALRAWFFPALGGTVWGNSIITVIGFAIVGTLFVIPTAGEIPIIQTFMKFGLGGGPASALLIVLPVISLPSALMVRRALAWRTLGLLGLGVAILGIIAGLIGMVFIA
ncbi:permease [Pullulanibacillus sp. KACC 23026]|uniref:permease n=1 Tax=Pullulanibacillus sp. KACC 23026 TaxID=3028315 RepID=UPI0023B07F4F|nr:permease [Pullulanibacillus sp. KACC 23026]WEG14599.1 permease [Pullulanibacillus sp. KACC 23026]